MTEHVCPKAVIAMRCASTTYVHRRSLMQFARAAGWDIVPIADCKEGAESVEKLRGLGFELHHIPVNQKSLNPLSDLRLLISTYRLLRRLRPQVFHGFTIKPIIYGLIAARLARVPVRIASLTGLGHAFVSAPAWLTSIASMLFRLALKNAHIVFFENRDDRDFFVARGIVDEGRTRLIAGSGVDVDHFRPELSEVRNDGRFTALYVGRLLVEKGAREFLKAARLARSQGLQVDFEVVGDIDIGHPSSLTRTEIEAAVACGDIQWHGAVEDVRPLIKKAGVVVLPSYREGTPLSLLEAAAMARPIIAADAPGCREPVVDGETGLLVPPGNPAAIVEAVALLARRPEAASEMGRKGRALMERRFASRIVYAEVLAAYNEVLQGNARLSRGRDFGRHGDRS